MQQPQAWEDYYRILQVDPGAEPEVIHSAYRRLALLYHPDVNSSPDADDNFKLINVAHDVLSDHALRAEYDRDYQANLVLKYRQEVARLEGITSRLERQLQDDARTRDRSAQRLEEVVRADEARRWQERARESEEEHVSQLRILDEAHKQTKRKTILGGFAVAAVAIFVIFHLSSSGEADDGIQSRVTAPTSAPVSQPAGDTPLPTPVPATRVPPTSSVPTPPPDTPPGTILEVGQVWRQGGLELLLLSVQLHPNSFDFYLQLTNKRATDTIFRVVLGDSFRVTTNQGRALVLGCPGADVSFTLKSDEKRQFKDCTSYNGGQRMYADGDLTPSAITELTITATGISSIENARWRVPVVH